ncbi:MULTISPECIES: siderophore-interacting protein [Nocardioides]|uniref:Siderophore-interacting protein n=1 Tax=Nocardioides vastitatis TaxID=2568655 RepID=A0ABW0ZLN1_9ACTN|nr:siderophore-interacting protein [Nocardioides sp.]THI96118.1 siderophore-interacting protein [Nocardioides sp.]
MHGRVVAAERLTPGLVRLTLGDGELSGFAMPDATDAYINVAIRPAGAPYDAVFDPAEVRATLPQDAWPARRRYTVRAWDAERRQLTVDFVVHGDDGVAGPWAAAAEPGDVLVFEGPSGGYRPDPAADWHFMVGDESALPAIAASLEAVPAGALAVVRLVCDGPDHELTLSSPGRLDVSWLHRTGALEDAELLPAAVRALTFPRGRVHAFIHGEAGEIREIRRHLLVDRGLSRADMSCSPYWRREMTDEAWRQVKRDFVAAMEAEVG